MSHSHFTFIIFCLFPIHFCSCFALANSSSSNKNVALFDVGVILDMDSLVGRIGWSCISMAVSDFYATHSNYKTTLALHLRDSQGDNIKVAFNALDLVQNVQVQAIIGPQKSRQADFVINLGEKAQIPIISFSATSPSLSFQTPYFIRAAQSDSSQVRAITAIIQAFKWRELIVIYEDSDFGNGLIPYLIDSCQEIQARIAYRSVISLSASDDQILQEVYKLMAMYTRLFVVHMTSSLGSRLFKNAKEAGMMSDGYIWIVTDGLMGMLDSMDSSVIASMQGILGIKPFIGKSKELDYFSLRWKTKFHQENPDIERAELNIFGLWAYDSVWALAMAAEEVSAKQSLYKKPRPINGTTISTSRNGQKLVDAILKARINGLSGDFHFVNGQLKPSIFQILNVIGKGDREIGFWTPECGISRELSLTCNQMYTTLMDNFRGIIWPGESMAVPKGWVIPTSGKKLKIGVPVSDSYNQIVWVDQDPYTNRTTTRGYIIDFFHSVIEALPYPIAYEFLPFQKADGSSAGSYNDLIYQVYLQRYDAVVGDTTITANRSLYVDFTLPYTEGGVSMMVPIKYDDRKNEWIFLKPLTRDLWLVSGAFFILTGIVIWVLEHRVNEAFRGPPSKHVGLILWFPLSTLVFAHRERVVSNLTRFVVIVWIFVVLILNSSYTASLSSMLTVQRLQPSITSIRELRENGDYVGYHQGSFVADLLKGLKFEDSKLKSFNSSQELNDSLLKGSQNGGIAAFCDVIPHLKLFMAKNCDKYTMVGPIHDTEGFGFVFPKGSPLVADVSRAILKVTEGGKLLEINQAWFKTSCSLLGNKVNSNSLKLSSFRGLFIITGTVSGFSMLGFLVVFLYKNMHILTAPDSGDTFCLRLRTMFKKFDKKDMSSYRFKKSDTDGGRSTEVQEYQASPGTGSRNIVEDHFQMEGTTIDTTGGALALPPLEVTISIDIEDSISVTPGLEETIGVRLSD